MAAGFDKHAIAPKGFASLGLSYLEIGTITPKPQDGNPKPRIECLDFQTKRLLLIEWALTVTVKDKLFERLNLLNWDHQTTPLGVNVGKNKLTPKSLL